MPCIPMTLDRTSFVHINILPRVSNEVMGFLLLLLLELIVILYSKAACWYGCEWWTHTRATGVCGRKRGSDQKNSDFKN